MRELIFEVGQEADGGFVAECLTEKPAGIRLHLVRDALLSGLR